MQLFKNVAWKTRLVEEPFVDNSGIQHSTAHYTISDWKIPFTFEEWCKEAGLTPTDKNIPENIYKHCSENLTRPACKQMVMEAATRLECDPRFYQSL